MNGETISPLRRRMIEDMTVRKFVEKTQKDYIRHVKGLTAFIGRSPDTNAHRPEAGRERWRVPSEPHGVATTQGLHERTRHRGRNRSKDRQSLSGVFSAIVLGVDRG